MREEASLDAAKSPDAPLRVLIATRCVVPIKPGHGGAEIAAYQLGRALAMRGHRVSIVADVESEPQSSERLELIRLDSRLQRWLRRMPGGFPRWILQHLLGNLLAAAAVRRLTRKRQFDVLHTNGPLSAVLISRFARVPLVYTEQDAPPWHCRYRHWWERWLRTLIYRALNVRAFRRADGIAATFDSLGEEIVRRWDVGSEVAVIPNAADAESFRPDASRRGRGPSSNGASAEKPGDGIERRRYGFDRYCLFAGELCSRKAPDILLRALSDTPDVHCVIAGEGIMRDHLEDLASVLGISERVAFVGRQSSENLARIYADADLLVLPSVSEASPLVVAEAMASGIPVIATRIAGIPSLVRDGETGFLVDPGDVAGLTESLRYAMGADALRVDMGARARASALEAFAWSAVAGSYESLYLTLLAGRGENAPAGSPPSTGGAGVRTGESASLPVELSRG